MGPRDQPSASVIAVSETHLAPTSLADIDAGVAAAAARAYADIHVEMERGITWAVTSYCAATLVGAVLLHPALLLLLMPHFWLFAGAVAVAVLSRRAFDARVPGLGQARAPVWAMLSRQGPAILRGNQRSRLSFRPAPMPAERVRELTEALLRAHEEALVPRKPWWRLR